MRCFRSVAETSLAALLLAGCAGQHGAAPSVGPLGHAGHAAPFVGYAPFSRADAIAIARGEWRLFGSPVDDLAPGERLRPPPEDKPERQPGLWQRVGEYWWLGQNADEPTAAWTGKHDEHGGEVEPTRDGAYPWSAAFISYVMRTAGAGDRFPYSPAHHTYIDLARRMADGSTQGWAVIAERLESYPPLPGDLICLSRTRRPLRYDDLPFGDYPSHCDIVVARSAGALEVIGGNVDDAVVLKHVPVSPEGRLAGPDGRVLDDRYPWFVALRIAYVR